MLLVSGFGSASRGSGALLESVVASESFAVVSYFYGREWGSLGRGSRRAVASGACCPPACEVQVTRLCIVRLMPPKAPRGAGSRDAMETAIPKH